MADSNGSIDSMVLNYLRQRGYKQTEEQLKGESLTVSLTDLAVGKCLDNDTALMNHIRFYDGSESHSECYEKLRDWAQSSLDVYKNELVSILFPIFAHCFLDLLKRQKLSEAQSFMEKHSGGHKETHANEVQSLSGLHSAEATEQCETAKLLLRQKTDVELCSYSFELLLNFLQKADLVLILGIMNQRLNVRVTGARPSSEVEHVVVGTPLAEVVDMNQKEIRWGLIDETNFEKKILAADEAAASAEGPASKKVKKEEQPGAQSMIPIPRLDTDTEKAIMEDLRSAVQLSPSVLPSICFYTFLNAQNTLTSVEMSRDSSVVCGCFSDSTMKIWHLDELNRQKDLALQGMADADQAKHGSVDGEVLPFTQLIGHSGPVYSASLSVDEKYLVSASADNTVLMWNMKMKTPLVCYRGHNYPVWDVKFSPLGYYFVSASHDRTARLWTTDRINPVRIFAGHLSDVDCVEFHPNCNYVATGSSDKTVRLWDVHNGNCVRIFTGHQAGINALSISPDGRVLATAGEDKMVMLWDLASGKRLRTLSGHRSAVWSLDFSNDGQMLATGGSDCSVRLWNSQCPTEDKVVVPGVRPPKHSAELLKTFPTKSTPVHTVTFTLRNLLLASGPFRPTP